MKNRKKVPVFFKTLFSFVCCCAIMVLGSYVYLAQNFNQAESPADVKDDTVPYAQAAPENAGIMFLLPDEKAVLLYMDFESTRIAAAIVKDYDSERDVYYGYTVDHTIKAEYSMLFGLIDRIGGAEMLIDGELMRYTGIQIGDIFSVSDDSEALTRAALQAIFKQISKNGFSKDDFVYIIENSKTDLTVPDCYYWDNYMKEMAMRAIIIN